LATTTRYPSLLQLNTRVWLARLSHEAGRRITLADSDEATIDGFAERGFDWIWLLSVWRTGAAANLGREPGAVLADGDGSGA
jgi:hypothetical protein